MVEEWKVAYFKNKYTYRFCEFMTSTKRGVLSADSEILAAAMRGADDNEE